ncbi:hypothetical protein [Methylacidimicrobium sp. B4]|uniref:hypothetical protein n=1 Tax=Methylacidimicrobium sp. B4 TaxID=2796139 RepID=UPI001A8DA3EB|nr:hypothetical protein [Methylacidimicrobium sp. B4]QSR85579.1 hypothetical protein MacB4_04990 [Methylacidimicrobium sp. B4]
MNSLLGEQEDAVAFRAGLFRITAGFSLLWLSAANLIGLWLALLLACPGLADLSGPAGYGRWMALHLDWQLYGWCSLPAVGVLLNRWLPRRPAALLLARWAFGLWSWVLALGGAWWLRGETSGKLFLDWSGLARICFVAMLVGLWGMLAFVLFRRRRASHGQGRSEGSACTPSVLDWLVLAGLGTVPLAIWTATKPQLYPPINPTSGGPTGTNLLGSTLAVVLILGLLPHLLEIPCRNRRVERLFWGCFLAESLLYLLLGHGDQSNRDGRQIGALASLLLWIPLLPLYLHSCGWAAGCRLWGISFAGWWTALVLTGFAFFLPGLLDAAKFSHLLVAHAHIAMAGMLTSLNMLLLLQLAAAHSADPGRLREPVRFSLWHLGLLFHLLVLCAVGWNEARTPGWLWHHAAEVRPLYWLRVVAGAGMTAVSLSWLLALLPGEGDGRDDTA